jgi:hypothetical protein
MLIKYRVYFFLLLISMNLAAAFSYSSLEEFIQDLANGDDNVERVSREKFEKSEDMVAIPTGFASCVKISSGVFLSIGHNFLKVHSADNSMPPVTISQGDSSPSIIHPKISDTEIEVYQIVRFGDAYFVVKYLSDSYIAKPIIARQIVEPSLEGQDFLRSDLATLVFTKKVDSLRDIDKYFLSNSEYKNFSVKEKSNWRASFMAVANPGSYKFEKAVWGLATNLVGFLFKSRIAVYNNLKLGRGASGGILMDEQNRIVAVLASHEDKFPVSAFLKNINHFGIFTRGVDFRKYMECELNRNGENIELKMNFIDATMARIVTKEDILEAFNLYLSGLTSS